MINWMYKIVLLIQYYFEINNTFCKGEKIENSTIWKYRVCDRRVYTGSLSKRYGLSLRRDTFKKFKKIICNFYTFEI